MGDLTWLWLTVAAVMLAVGVWLLVRELKILRLPASVGGVRLELTPAVVVEDRVLEVVWTISFLATNTTRKPRMVPLLGSRADVRTVRARYRGDVTTEIDWAFGDGSRLELNPAGTAIGVVQVTLPAGEAPRSVILRLLLPDQRTVHAKVPG